MSICRGADSACFQLVVAVTYPALSCIHFLAVLWLSCFSNIHTHGSFERSCFAKLSPSQAAQPFSGRFFAVCCSCTAALLVGQDFCPLNVSWLSAALLFRAWRMLQQQATNMALQAQWQESQQQV